MDLSSGMFITVLCDTETEQVRPGVVANGVQVVLGEVAVIQVDIGVQDALLARVEGLYQLLSVRSEDHTETAAGSTCIIVVLQETFLPVLLRQDLRRRHDEASTFHGHDL